jgi:hypothetical protein
MKPMYEFVQAKLPCSSLHSLDDNPTMIANIKTQSQASIFLRHCETHIVHYQARLSAHWPQISLPATYFLFTKEMATNQF